VEIQPSTQYVNVKQGQTVRFVSGKQEFAYKFDGAPDITSFDLRRVAPAGMLDHAVVAYVQPTAGVGY
jgi:hypothetical protein